jgi:hypothetical protein
VATNVVFNGVTYSVPTTSGESGWATTLSAYLQALASGAATTSTVKQAIRTATSTPVTVVAATDYTVVTNLTVPGAVAVNLPAGVAKQVFVIVDGKGDAATNAITIDGNGAETINGAANYVINENYGGVILQFDGTGWVILAGFYGADPTFTSLTVTTLGVTGTATVGTLSATNATVGGANVTTVSNTQSFTNKTFDADGTGNSITNIENADIKTGAAIDRAKLASGTPAHVVINDGSGVLSSEAQLAKSRGGTGADNSSVTFPASGTLVTEAGTQTLTNKTITSAELDTPLIDDYFDINEESAPGTPAAGKVRVYAKTDAKLYKKDDNGVEQEIGAGGGGGGVNYIANPLFADGTVTGWATYADAAGTTPVDGTGGSPNVTFTAQTGALVRGTFSGRLTKDAANRQGQGASYNFTIDAADTGRPVGIAFDFLASAAYVANDVGVYIYDVTNATLITPAAINVAAGKGTFKAFFVATTSTSYRLILHVASTSASAWTLDTDNFQVGPQVQLSGGSTTDLRTVSGASINWTNTTTTAQVAQDADRGRFRIAVVATGTPGAVSSAIVTLPTGFVIDTSKLLLTGVGETILGTATIQDDSIANYGPYVVAYESTTTVRILNVTTSAPHAFAVGDSITLDFVAPIANWSSNVTSLAAANPEYAFNTAATTAAGGSDTTSFGYGIAGTPFNAFNSSTLNNQTTLRVRFQTPIQATDRIAIEVQGSSLTAPWFEANAPALLGGTRVNTAIYGIEWSRVVGSTTDIDVKFGNAGGTAYANTFAGTGGDAWSGYTGLRWRAKKQSPLTEGILPVSARAVVRDVTGTAIQTGLIGETLRTESGTVTQASNAYTAVATRVLTVGTWLVSANAQINVLGTMSTAEYVADLKGTSSANAPKYAASSLFSATNTPTRIALSVGPFVVRYDGTNIIFPDGTTVSGATLTLNVYAGVYTGTNNTAAGVINAVGIA